MQLIAFIKSRQDKINEMQKLFVDLFNECGTKYTTSAMQLGLTGAICAIFLKNTNMPNSEIQKVLENLKEKFK